METREAIILLIGSVLLICTWLWGILKSIANKELKSRFFEFRMETGKVIALYVSTEEKNRYLTLLLNRFCVATKETYLNSLDFKDMREWCTRYEIPTTFFYVQGTSEKDYVEKMRKEMEKIIEKHERHF